MEYDYNELNVIITEKFQTNRAFALAIGLSERSLSLKLNNEVPFKQPQIDKAAEVLNLKPEQIPKYFFKKKVQ